MTITEEERDLVREHQSLCKDFEATRKTRIDNDTKEGRTVDAEALADRVAGIIKSVDEVLEHQVLDILPARIIARDTLDEARGQAREVLETIKVEFSKVWDQFKSA